MSTTTIEISGMTCQHCVAAVTKALQSLPGVESVKVDLDAARATVEGTAPERDLIDAVTRAGYGATCER